MEEHVRSAAIDIASIVSNYSPTAAKSLARGGDHFDTVLARIGHDGKSNLVDLTADRPLPSDPEPATPATGSPTVTVVSGKSGDGSVASLGPLPGDQTPIQRLKQGLEASGQDLSNMTLPKEAATKLEELLVKSGYDRATARQIIKQASDEEGNVNLGAMFQVMEGYTPSESPLLSLPITDKPLLIQALQQLGLDGQKVREFVESLPVEGNFINLTGIGKLLTQAGDQAQQVDISVVRDLLTGLGLSTEEADALIVKSADTLGRMSPRDLLAMLKSAASTQSSALTASLKELAARIRIGDTGNSESDAAKLKAQVNEILRSGASADNAAGVQKAVASAKAAASDPQQVVEAARAQANETSRFSPAQEYQAAQQKTENLGFKEMYSAIEGDDPQLQGEALRLARAGQSETVATVAKADTAARAVTAAASSAQTGSDANGQSMGEAQTQAGVRTVSGASGGRAVLPAHVVRQVGAQIANMAKNNQSVMRIALRPAHLGGLKMTLEASDGAVKATLAAETVAAKGILESGLSQLRESLAAQGLKVDRLEVIVDPDAQSGQGRASGREQEGRGASGNGAGSAASEAEAALAAAAEGAAGGRTPDGGLSIFA